MNERKSLPFDPAVEKLYCSRCGRECEPRGHLLSQFLLCPVHGEFTIAPVVVHTGLGWRIEATEQMISMWETCRYLDRSGLGG